MRRIEEIKKLLIEFEGISRKFVLPSIIRRLREESFNGNTPHSLGEDSAAIGTNSDEMILLTTDSIVEELCLNHPHAAGFNVVLANVMDIYAAGGTPTSFAAALSYSEPNIGEELLNGLIEGSRKFRVPIIRGHTNPTASSTYVVGSSTGTVKRADMLTAGGALEGDSLVLIFCSTGKRGESYRLGWDCVTERTSDEVVSRLSVMNSLAMERVLNASKDVSVAGLIGTAGMLVEYSGKGGVIDLDAVEKTRPDSIIFDDWIRMFVSMGFLVSTPPENLERVFSIVERHHMRAEVIGIVDSTDSLRIRLGDEELVLFDFSEGPVLTPHGT
ncbi:MAG: AIR synthase related protein [Candidatus Thorarchaeota archaeon]